MNGARTRKGGRTLVEFVFMIHAREVEHLLGISANLKRRSDREVVNRASVVFLMAVWQTYVEAVIDDAIAKMPSPPSVSSSTRLSTPSPDRIDELFEKRLGIKTVSQHWKWRGMTPDRAHRKLNAILKLRHQIAHKARTKAPVKRRAVLEYVHFVHRLAVCLFNATSSYVATQSGLCSRSRMQYRRRIGELS